MAYIPENQINDLKDRLDIIDIISQYVDLKRAGASYKGLCPFHHEKTPSFSVSPERNTFHCFGCHEGGDAISFIMKIENLGYIDAIRFLADKMGITLEEGHYSHSKTQKKQRMYEINSLAAKYYMKNLLTHKFPQNYMEQRGLKKSILNKFFLGYAKGTPDRQNNDLINYLESKNVSTEEMEELGLVVNRDGNYFDRFVERLIFPILNAKNQVIGFGARTLTNSKIKYLNSPESEIFIKGKNLYGVNIVNKSRKRTKVLLVEGYMDVIGLYNQGIDYSLASLGTALTPDQAKLIKRYSKDILIAYDGDEAGVKATLRAIDIFKNMDVNLGIMQLEQGLDPDDFIIKYGKDSFHELENKALKPIDFKLEKLYETHPNKLDFIKDIIEFLAEIDGNTVRDLYITKSANFIGTSTDSLRKDVDVRRQEILDKEKFKKSYNSSPNGYSNTKDYKSLERDSVKTRPQASRLSSNELKLEKELVILSILDEDKYQFFKYDSDIIQDPDISELYTSLQDLYSKGDNPEKILETDLFKSLKLDLDYQEAKNSPRSNDMAKELKERIKIYKLTKRKRELEEILKKDSSDQEAFLELTDILKKLT